MHAGDNDLVKKYHQLHKSCRPLMSSEQAQKRELDSPPFPSMLRDSAQMRTPGRTLHSTAASTGLNLTLSSCGSLVSVGDAAADAETHRPLAGSGMHCLKGLRDLLELLIRQFSAERASIRDSAAWRTAV
jgi:hypothetical protein